MGTRKMKTKKVTRKRTINNLLFHLGLSRRTFFRAATLTRSMCRSTFEDPIGVNFIITLLYSCARNTPRVCTLAFHYCLH